VSNQPEGVRRFPAVLVTVIAVLAVVAGVVAARAGVTPAVAFAQVGHWVFNRSEQAVVHVDSGTRAVDASVAVPGAADDALFAVQGEKQGFLVGRQSITVFGKSTLTVDSTLPTGQVEVPIGLEVVGGPYLVYRQAGTVVRLGVPPTSIQAGGPLGRPVATDDGTLWLHRTDTGALCALRRAAGALDCGVQVPTGHAGSLAIATRSPVFVDTAQDAAQVVSTERLGTAVGVGADLPETALVADRDTEGRLPAVVPGPSTRLLLLDSGGVPAARPGGEPIVIDLGAGEFTSPAAYDGVVAVLEQTRHRLLTFRIDGSPLGVTDLPAGELSLVRGGDGRLYVDDADGNTTHVLEADGSATAVPTGGAKSATVAAPQDRAVLVPPTRPQPKTGPPVRSENPPRPAPQQPSAPVEAGPVAPVVAPVPNPPVVAPPAPVQPPEPVVTLPAAPQGVRAAVADDGTVTVSWTAVADAESYSAQGGDAAPQTTAATKATFRNLTAGTSYTFRVTASNQAGAGPQSAASNAVVIPVGPPGAPTGVTLTRSNDGARAMPLTPSWQRPDLNGGELVEYQVVAFDGNNKKVLDTTSTIESAPTYFGDGCLAPYRFEIRAVTRTPGTDQTRTGPPGRAATASFTCQVNMTIAAQATAADTITVQLHDAPPDEPTVGGDCSLQFNGVTKWTGTCKGFYGGEQPPTAVVDGLTPATAYKIVLKIVQVKGPATTSNTVTVTTPA
jgi:hypothetical protein